MSNTANPTSPKVGVSAPTLTIDPTTGDGVLTWMLHTPTGVTLNGGPVPMPAVQIAYALSRLVTAAGQLQTQLTASGGKPTDEIIATIGAEVLSWLRIESADIAPVAHVGTDLLT